MKQLRVIESGSPVTRSYEISDRGGKMTKHAKKGRLGCEP